MDSLKSYEPPHSGLSQSTGILDFTDKPESKSQDTKSPNSGTKLREDLSIYLIIGVYDFSQSEKFDVPDTKKNQDTSPFV